MGLGEEKALLGEEIVHDQVINVLFYSLLLYQISIMRRTMTRETIKAGMIVRNVQSSDRRPSILYNLDHEQAQDRATSAPQCLIPFNVDGQKTKISVFYFVAVSEFVS